MKKILVGSVLFLSASLIWGSNSTSAAEFKKPNLEKLSEETGVSISELEKRWNEYEDNGFQLENTISESTTLNNEENPRIGTMGTINNGWHAGDIEANYYVKATRDFWWNNKWTSSAVTTTKQKGTNYNTDEISASIKIYDKRSAGSVDYYVSATNSDKNTNYHNASAVAGGKSDTKSYSLGTFKWKDSKFGTISQTLRINH